MDGPHTNSAWACEWASMVGRMQDPFPADNVDPGGHTVVGDPPRLGEHLAGESPEAVLQECESSSSLVGRSGGGEADLHAVGEALEGAEGLLEALHGCCCDGGVWKAPPGRRHWG